MFHKDRNFDPYSTGAVSVQGTPTPEEIDLAVANGPAGKLLAGIRKALGKK